MPLDAEARAYLERVEAEPQPDPSTGPIEDYREAALRVVELGPASAELAEVRDTTAPGPAGKIPLRIYVPQGVGPFGALVYLHGGGWARGDLESHDRLCRALSASTPCVVVAVHYRRPPEHPFPAALEDCDAATTWVAEHAAEFGADPTRVAVAGDSAGGNMATAVARRARDRDAPHLVHQGLYYPAVDGTLTSPSIDELAEGYGLTRASLEWCYDTYAPVSVDRTEPDLSPLWTEDLGELPPALVITAEFDPVRDEGEDYAERMRCAGVSVESTRYEGTIHNFMLLAGVMETGRTALDQAARALRDAFEADPSGPPPG